MTSFLITVGLVLGVFVFLIFHASQKNTNQQRENEKWLNDNGFTKYFINFLTNDAIGIDYERSKIGIISKKQKNIFDFKNIVSVELIEDGKTISKTNRGSQLFGAAIGAVTFGAVGGIIGGLSGASRSTNNVSKNSIHIFTRDIDVPFVEIRVFEGVPVDKSNFTYKLYTENMMPWYGRLKAIIEQ